MRWDDRLVVVLALVAAPLAGTTGAEAHSTATYHPLRWTAQTATWRFTPSVPEAFRPPSRTGAGVWNNIGRDFRFVEAAAYTTNFNQYATDYCQTARDSSIHVGTPQMPGAAAETGGCALASDNSVRTRFFITIRANYDFYTGTGTQGTRQDLEAVMAHEFGHAHGARHFTEATSPDPTACPTPVTFMFSTMCHNVPGGTVHQRSPEPHDIHTFANVYSGNNSICGYVVYGSIRPAYLRVGGSTGHNGCPLIEEADTANNGRRQNMQYGSIVWHPASGAYEVRGDIRGLYDSLGGGAWGFPTTDESPTPDGTGRFNHFLVLGQSTNCGTPGSRSIYWHPSTGAHNVQGAIRQKWCALGWEGGFGYPATNESPTPDGRGWFNHFLRIGSTASCGTPGDRSIYYRNETGAHEVHGSIRQRWCAVGWEGGNLGYPTTDELVTSSGVGRYTHFSKYSGTTWLHDGSIFWSSSSGAWEVFGKIRDKYASLSWERGFLGYPTAGQVALTGGQRSIFQGGHIYWATGFGQAYEMHGPILTRYVNDNGTSAYGFPITDVYHPATSPAGDLQVDFPAHSIRYVAATGTTKVCSGRC